ncbi:polyamine ABC transporter substrate-binding protein [Martelella alba]|uniref:Putrescine-binding periplasmic protein n=1 Tax=Martelella alba TaxID=2590451 RepID=A0A506U497_9HYPH|nr:polyamine ABC transporter substrate-binding protein [Martelella alba]TPW28278.1 polyamine ABC transporter substrate-binding protein [Martelella alba]
MKTVFVTLAAGILATHAAAAEEIHVYNWSDYIDPDLLETFEQETGIHVVYDVFDSNELLETKLLAGHSGYDVVVPSGEFLQRQIKAGVFQKLDKSSLPNLKNMWPEIEKRAAIFDPDNAYSVNYMWGTTGIGVNPEKVRDVLGEDAPVDSLALVFDPDNMSKLATCGVSFLDAPKEMFPAALEYLGKDPDSHDPADLAAAEELLDTVRPYVGKFDSSDYINELANGNICVAFGWSGDILQAADQADEADNGVSVEYHIPKEGAAMWFDEMAIPADAPNPAGALAFINFMMDPQNIAKSTNYVFYANGNLAAQAYVDKDILDDPSIYPPEEVMQRLFITTPYDAKVQRSATRLWTQLKSGT